jgi:hypothetical protein
MNDVNVNCYIDFGQLSRDDLMRALRELRSGMDLLLDDSPARPLMRAQVIAVQKEIANRPVNANEETGEPAVRSGQDEKALLVALEREYHDEWRVWKPGNYAADHKRIDVGLVSGSLEGLADKLRIFTELIKDLPW